MDHLQHDPRTKQQIKEALYMFLYRPVLEQFSTRLETLIVKNCVLLGISDRMFSYKGEIYNTVLNTRLRVVPRLHKQLYKEMDGYLTELKQLNSYELPFVLGFISQVLNASNDLNDYLRVLPASVHRPVEQLIANCPCRTVKLTQESITALQSRNKVPISLMKERMLTNLLL